ncbi:MAG: HAMP domain-containing sensor histidine kinase [Filifactor alocis]|nr:HAMP domain-containing sensor histidine kinase [Filifactor alocis]
MFNRSRRKIILSIMGSLILLFAITLTVILLASFREVRKKNRDMLERYIEMYSLDPRWENHVEPGPPPKREPPMDAGPDFELLTFYAVSIAYDGSILAVDDGGKEVYDVDELIRFAREILNENKRSGRSGNLTYAVAERDGYTLVAFMDNTVSEGGLRTLLRYVLIVGSFAIAVLFFISLVLSKRIIRPLEENDRQQKQFISDASHELKTPVAVIATSADILSREIGDNEWLANIRYENERMGELVKQLLELSRAENAEVPMERIDYSRLITGEILAFESLAFDRGKILQTVIEEGIVLTGNQAQLTQLSSILLDNAIRHSTGSKIEVSLSCRAHTAVLSVVNDGEEIPRQNLEHLFDRFYRIDQARNDAGHHYGLGLSIAKAVVEKHGGVIETSCRNGKIKFGVTLPIKNKI